MRNRWVERCRLLAVGVVLASVVCGTSVAFAFTDIPALPSDPETLGRTTVFPDGELLGGGGDQNHVVKKVFFWAGDTIDVTLNAGDQVGVSIFTEEAVSVLSPSEPYVSTGTGASPRNLTFVPPYTGIYYVDAYTLPSGSSSNCALRVDQRRVMTDLVLTPVKNMTYGSTTEITGVVVGGFEGEVLTGDVVLSYSFGGPFYFPVLSQPLVDGAFVFDGLTPLQKVYYKVHYVGTSAFGPSADKGTISTTALLSRVTAKRYATRSYALSGTLNPGLDEGSPAATVRVYLWRYVNHTWKAAGYRTAKASGLYVNAKYSTKYRFPYKGTWKTRAYHADADHLKTWGAPTTLTVK